MMVYIDRLLSKDEVMGYSLICFDRDHTLVSPRHDPDGFVQGFNFDLLPGRKRCLMTLAYQIPMAICSNQGGIAAGYKSRDQLLLEIGFLNGLMNFACLHIYCLSPVQSRGREVIAIDAFGFPIKIINDEDLIEIGYRKPNPGMLLLAAETLGIPDHGRCLFVGDRREDIEAAKNADELDQDRNWDCISAWDFPWGGF